MQTKCKSEHGEEHFQPQLVPNILSSSHPLQLKSWHFHAACVSHFHKYLSAKTAALAHEMSHCGPLERADPNEHLSQVIHLLMLINAYQPWWSIYWSHLSENNENPSRWIRMSSVWRSSVRPHRQQKCGGNKMRSNLPQSLAVLNHSYTNLKPF